MTSIGLSKYGMDCMPQNVYLKPSLDVGAKFNKHKIMKGTQKTYPLETSGLVSMYINIYNFSIPVQLIYSCITYR